MNKGVFPFARPALDALFPNDRLFHRVVRLEPDEPLDPVSPCESLSQFLAMLVDAAEQVRRDARVEGAVRRSGEQIYAGMAVHGRSREQGGSRLKAGMTEKPRKAGPGSRPG